MIRPLSCVLAALILACACTTPAIGHPPPLSKNQSRELPENIVADRVAKQLADILVSTPMGTPGVRPLRPLSDIWYWTTPRVTDTPDVCESDEVIFSFSYPARVKADADTPTRVSGVSATTRYHLLAPPPPGPREILTDAGVADLQRHCDDINPDKLQMISAPNASFVREGAKLFNETIAAAVGAPELFNLDCGGNRKCLDDIQHLTFADVGGIDRCGLFQTDYSLSCTQFSASNYRFNVYERGDKITKVDASELIILSHARID